MSYLKNLRERADEPFLPAEPKLEEPKEETKTLTPAVGVGTADVPETQVAPQALTPAVPKYDSSDLERALASLDSTDLVKQVSRAGISEAQKAMELSVREGAGASANDVLDYLGGRARDTEIVQLFSRPVKVKAPEGQTVEDLEDVANLKSVRPYEDIVTDTFDAALKGRYIQQAVEGIEDEAERKEAAAAAKVKYRKDIENFREGLAKAGREATTRDAKAYLAAMYGNALSPRSNVNVLAVAARDGAGDAVEVFRTGMFEQAMEAGPFQTLVDAYSRATDDPGAEGDIYGLTKKVVTGSLFEGEDERATRVREVTQALPNIVYERLVKRKLFDPRVKPQMSEDAARILRQGRVKQTAPATTTVVSADALRVGEALNLPGAVVAGIMAAESGGSPTARAFNLHRMLRDPSVTDEQTERIYAALAEAGYDVDEKRRLFEAGEVVPFFGADGEKALKTVFDINPAAAARATAWGKFQVMGREGGILDLMKSIAKEQGGVDLNEEQAARAAYRIFASGQGANEVSDALLVNWFRNSPRAYAAAQKVPETGDVEGLSRLYVGRAASGRSQRDAWNANFRKGYEAYTAQRLETPEPSTSEQPIDEPSEAALREQQVRVEEDAALIEGGRLENIAGPLADVLLPGSAEQTYAQEAEAEKQGLNFVQVASDAFGSNDKLYLPAPESEDGLAARKMVEEYQAGTGLQIQNYANLGMGRGFSKLQQDARAKALQDAVNEADRQGLEGEAREQYLDEARRKAAQQATLAVVSAQTSGLWVNPVVTSMREATGIGGETALEDAPEFIRAYAEALAPKIELLGRNGDEIIYRQEGGGQALLSTLDAIPLIGQSFNVGVINNYVVPQLEALGLDHETAQAISPFVAIAGVMASPFVAPALLFGGQYDDIYYAGVAGVGDRDELVQYGMETLSAQAGTLAEVSTPLLEWADEREMLSWATPGNVTGTEERVLAVKDSARALGTFAGMGVGLLGAVLHPDLLGGAASGIRGLSVAGRTMRATDVTRPLQDSIVSRRADIWSAGTRRQAATMEAFARNDEAERLAEVADRETLDAMLTETREDIVARLREADEYDEGLRVLATAAMDEVDKNQGVILGRMAADGVNGAKMAADPKASRRLGAIIEASIEAAKNSDDPRRVAKAEALEQAIEQSGMRGRLDLLALSPSRTDITSAVSEEAKTAFGTADRMDIMLRALEIVDDVELTEEPRLRLLARSLTGTPVETFNGKPMSAYEGVPARVVTVSPTGDNDLLSVFGLVSPETFEANLQTTRSVGGQTADQMRNALRAKYEAVAEYISDLRFAVTSGEIIDADVIQDFVNRGVEIELGDTNYRMLRNSRSGTDGMNLQRVVQSILDEAEAMRSASYVTDTLRDGLAAVATISLTRGEALRDLARSRTSGISPEAVDAFLDAGGEGARLQRAFSAVMAGTVEGMTTMLQGTPFIGKMFGGEVGTYQARMARLHLARADGSDPMSFASAMQRDQAARLRARMKAMEDGAEGEALEVIRQGESYLKYKADLQRVESPEWHASVVRWLHRARNQRRDGVAVEMFDDLPVGTDLQVFQKFGRRVRPAKATRKFLARTKFFDAFGFAGETEDRQRAFSQRMRTRRKKISKKERRAVTAVIDQMAKGAAGVTDEMRPAEVEQRLTAFYDNVLNVQREVGKRKYKEGAEAAVENIRQAYRTDLTQRLADVLAPVDESVPAGAVVTEVDPQGLVTGEWYEVVSAGDGAAEVRRYQSGSTSTTSVPLGRLRTIAPDAGVDLRAVVAESYFHAVEVALDVMDPETAQQVFGMAKQDVRDAIEAHRAGRGDGRANVLLQAAAKRSRDLVEVLSDGSSAPPRGFSVFGGDPDDFDVALGADDVDDVDSLFSRNGINYSGRAYEVVRDADGEPVAASAVGRREDTGEMTFDIVVNPEVRRRGLARMLVERIIAEHPGESFNVWVVNENMASLLEDIGFTADFRGWSPDSPHMTAQTLTREGAKQEMVNRARARAQVAADAEAHAARRVDEESAFLLRMYASMLKAADLPPEEVTKSALVHINPRRYEDPEFRRVVHQRVLSGDTQGSATYLRRNIPLDAEGEIDPTRFARQVERFDRVVDDAEAALSRGGSPGEPLFQRSDVPEDDLSVARGRQINNLVDKFIRLNQAEDLFERARRAFAGDRLDDVRASDLASEVGSRRTPPGEPPEPPEPPTPVDVEEVPDDGPMPKGMTRFYDDAQAVITAFSRADVSTGMHELAHVMRRQLGESQQQTIVDWVNKTLDADGAAKVEVARGDNGAFIFKSDDLQSVIEAEEMFARAFERYLREGAVPMSSLRSAFRAMKNMLTRVYQTIRGTGIDVDISPEMYDLFDDLFGAQRQISLDDVADVSRYLDMQEQLQRAATEARTAQPGTAQRRFTGADRIVEQATEERTFIDRMRQARASIEDYRTRGVSFTAPDLGTKDEAVKSGRTVGPGRQGKARIGQDAIGPWTRRSMSPEEVVAARRGDEAALAKFKRRRFFDKILVDSAAAATGWTNLTLFGDDHVRALRAANPALRAALRGAGRELEEVTSELSLLIRDVSMTSGAARAAAERRLLRYFLGPDSPEVGFPLLATGARRGQRARQNFVNASRALSDLVDDFLGLVSDGALKALTDDTEFVLAGLTDADAVDIRSRESGALDAFWRGATVAPEGSRSAAVVEEGLVIREEVVQRLEDALMTKAGKANLSELQTDMLQSIYTALTGATKPMSGRVETGARNLAALLVFATGNGAVTKNGVRLSIDDLVQSNGARVDHASRMLNFVYYGGELRREGESVTIPGIRTGAAEDMPANQQFAALLMMGINGNAAGILKDYERLGFGLSPRDVRAYNLYKSGRTDLLSPAEVERAIELHDQYGYTSFDLSPMATGGVYLPAETRAGLAAQLQQAQRQLGQTSAPVSMVGEWLRRSAGWVLSGIIFGTLIGRQAFKLMSTQDTAYQLGLVAGGPAGIAAGVRASALTFLSAVGGERAAQISEEAVRRLASATPGDAIERFAKTYIGGDTESFKHRLRTAAVEGGDEFVRKVTDFLGQSKHRVEVAPIMDNRDEVFVIGGSAYNARDLRREFTRAGLYSNAYKEVRYLLSRDFDQSEGSRRRGDISQAEVERMLGEAGASPANISFFTSLISDPGDAYQRGRRATRRVSSTLLEHGLESADAWSDLERTGSAVTLMERGYKPYDAGKLVVEAVYDYRGSMGEGDRALWRKLLMPFWAFRKNANIQFANLAADPSTAFRMMALGRAARWAPQALTYVLYESILEPYDVNVDGMSGSQRDLYYNVRMHLEYGYGDEVKPEVLEQYRRMLPDELAEMSDEELMDHSFDGWTIREGFRGYPGVPEDMKMVMRALIAGRGNASTRRDGNIYDLQTTIINRQDRDRFVQMGQEVYAQQGPSNAGIAAWAAKRPNIQLPVPVLDEYAQEVHRMTRFNEAGRENVAGLSFYFVLPDNFIMAASDMAAASLLAPAVLGAQALDEYDNVNKTMVINAFENLVDVRGYGSPLGQLAVSAAEAAIAEDRDVGKVRLHPLMARALEGTLGVPVPRLPAAAMHAAGMGTTAGSNVFAGERQGRRRTFSRPRDLDISIDPETGERVVAPSPLPGDIEYVNPRDEMYAYQPYLYGPVAAMFPNSVAGQINSWLLANWDDSSEEAALRSGESLRNFALSLLLDTARLSGTRVMQEDPELSAIIDRPRLNN